VGMRAWMLFHLQIIVLVAVGEGGNADWGAGEYDKRRWAISAAGGFEAKKGKGKGMWNIPLEILVLVMDH